LLLGLAGVLASVHAVAPAADVVYFVGDSITAGVGVGDGAIWRDAYPSRARDDLCGFGCSQAHVVGHGGQCLVATGCLYGPTLLATFGPEVLDAVPKPTVVVVEIGVNDLYHVTDTQLEDGFQQLVAQGQAVDVRVVLGTITPTNSVWPWHDLIKAQQQRVDDWLRATYASTGNLADFAASLQDGNGDLYSFYSEDGLHPNRWAAQVMADVTVMVGL
jgi:lysophospholipase L1-like esterase